MKISYNWLKQYINIDLPATKIAELLTDCGLEVESVEKQTPIAGGLEGMVVGQVMTRDKHPDADRLSVTTVDIGTGTLLNIVCGAANVAAGQKVIIATIGAKLYPSVGEPFEIKKSKIRGQLSEGMICAEDEIGLGTSHEGIMVLDENAVIGTPAKTYFNLQDDYIFEIGLTPNRADAASHLGVARDLLAVVNYLASKNETNTYTLTLPSVAALQESINKPTITVKVEDTLACPRYSAIHITGVTIKESPDWLKLKLKAIGVASINNVVDVTNFVLHEIGQPLHAFDANKIEGDKIIVKKLAAKTKFVTLDNVTRELSENDLMICDAVKPLCIAGVYGGADSGITNATTAVFLESAYFDSVHVRKTSKHHGIKTDSSFRFERGTDPNITVYALKRAALLIQEVAGGTIDTELVDVYPSKIEHFKVGLSYNNLNKFSGKEIEKKAVKTILSNLGIEIITEGTDALLLSVPPYKVDVKREVDVIEEILRVYGYNNIEIPTALRSSISYSIKPNPEEVQNKVADFFSDNGFNEILTNSLTKESYLQLSNNDEQKSEVVKIINPLSTDLNIMRQTLLYSGLEAIAYNINRKNNNLKLYEFGKIYFAKADKKFTEQKHLSIFITGDDIVASWNAKSKKATTYLLKGYVEAVLQKLGLTGITLQKATNPNLSENSCYVQNKKTLIEIGKVKKAVLKNIDIKQDVFYANIDWDALLLSVKKHKISYTEISKFPAVQRDLALVIPHAISYQQLEQIAFETERKLLKRVELFDVYQGDKIASDKKSYALSFTLLDESNTLSDTQIEKVMSKLIKAYQEKVNAEIRGLVAS